MSIYVIRSAAWIAAMALAIGILSAIPSSAPAAGLVDRIRLVRGSESGEITSTTPLEVTVEKASGGPRSVAVNEIRSIVFDGEPSELTQARLFANNGGYDNALEKLYAVDQSRLSRSIVREEVEFLLAFCAGKRALAGSAQIVDAGRQLNDFVRQHPQSFHYLEAVELMGDLLAASGKYPAAEKQYAELAKTPWPDYRMRAAVLVGRTLQVQGKHSEAIRQFDVVLAMRDNSRATRDAQLSATLGKAVSLAETERLDDAVRMIEEIIQKSDPEDKELQARTYNALGQCYEKAGRTKDAVLAFLHVDVLYSTVPDAHAEALSHLVPLWEAIGEPARAREARQVLNERYANTRWAQ